MSFFSGITSAISDLSSNITNEIENITGTNNEENTSNTNTDQKTSALPLPAKNNRFNSFAPIRHSGNDAKWYVDGCGYMWAVSVAIEEAKESIWILDWWLSPELYLRRPPTQNEEYRIDRMLLAAAERGVKVNVIIYKEVSAVLTLCSDHTKKALQLHDNIAVFRHPDHAPSGQVLESSLISSIQNFSLKSLQLADIPEDAFKALYGVNHDVVLYWAHHEKLCLVDGDIAFMGGLDLCFGRWDTNQHAIADAHPTDLDKAIFPGQDYNNARIMDFEDVAKFDQNKLDRTKSSRMGWSDISICLRGPVVQDLKAHFVQRWDFIFEEKYNVKGDPRYGLIELSQADTADGYYKANGKTTVPIVGDEASGDTTAVTATGGETHHRFRGMLKQFAGGIGGYQYGGDQQQDSSQDGMSIQLVRSCTDWSNGVPTELSICNAYCSIIRESKHFVYIENQFFITATGDEQHPVKNQIGAAMVERIVRAHNAGEKYKMIICMPSVPAFAGDLHADDSLGTRAIMEYQYQSICRGGHSIMEACEQAGVPDPKEYIRFYNLRNYDRINAGATMDKVQQDSGVNYEDGRREHDDVVGAGYNGDGEQTGATYGQENPEYERYQRAGAQTSNFDDKYDTVSTCYMENGASITDIPWSGSEEAELQAFVSEELYIHSKVLIADDRIVICGSANLNDRSQLGYHDSEIAVIIEDPTPVESRMNGVPFTASKFAASLRRQLFRKHLGLLPIQDCEKPDANFTPVTKEANEYDWDSDADRAVTDPLSSEFEDLWNSTAKTNTEVFAKAFHVVPDDNVRNWDQYKEFYSQMFVGSGKEGDHDYVKPRYEYGHVVRDEFAGGVREVKEYLGRVRGTLVEMPLRFMEEVDFAKEGLKLNALTDDVYT